MKVRLVDATITDSAGSVEIHRVKERGLLGLLALTPGRVVSVDRLIDGLWGDEPPRTAAKTLQTYIKNLRAHIATSGAARDTLRTDPPGYLLTISANDVDLLRFESECAAAASAAGDGRLHDADHGYSEALAIVANTDFAMFDAPGLDGAAIRFEEQRRRAIDGHVDVQLALGRHGDLVSRLASRLETEVANERCWAQFMTALYRSGRQRDALQAFATAREKMAQEYGLEPGPALVALESQILRQELPEVTPAIAAQPAAIPPPATEAIALTLTSASLSPSALAELASRAIAPSEVLEYRDSEHGYRVVVGSRNTATLLARRIRRQADDVRVIAVADGIANEAVAIASLLDEPASILFAHDIGTPSAQRQWARSGAGLVAPEPVQPLLRVPSALDHLRNRMPGYITRAGDLEIDDYVAALKRGERRVVRLNGAAGIGKSSWLAHAAHVMTTQGCAVLYGSASTADGGSHDALADAAYQAVMMLDRYELEDHVQRYGLTVSDVVPEIQSRVGTASTAATAPSPAEVETALLDLFERLARNVPTTLLIDDAPQLADASTQLLVRLLTNQRSTALGLVLTCRVHDPHGPTLAPQLAELCAARAIELLPFTVDQTARFLESVAGLERSPRTMQVAELVNTTTLGLPLFVSEMAHDLAQSSEWFTASGKFRIDRSPDNLTLPSSLHDLLRQRLDRLDDEAQWLASVGAVFGEFSTLLVAAVSELPVGDVLGALDRLMAQRIIEPIAGLADHYQFAHPLLRSAAVYDTGSARTAAIAFAAAEYLSAQSTPTPRQLDRRAELWFRSLPLAPIDRVEYELDGAAAAAHERSDHRQQITHLTRRVQITESAARPVPVSVRVALAEASADAQIEAGTRRSRARIAFEAAVDAQDGELAARAALAFAGPFNPYGSLVTVDNEGVSMAHRALDMDVTRVELQAQLWGMAAAAASDVTGAADEIKTALALAEPAEHPLLHGQLLSLAHALQSSANPVEQRLLDNQHIIATGRSHNDRGLELQGWGWMAADAFEAGDSDLLDQAAAQRFDIVERLDDTTYRWSHLVYQGMRSTISGRFDEAETLIWQALEVGRLPLADHANRFFGLQLLKLSEMRGQGRAMLAPAYDHAKQLGYITAYVSLAHLHAELGEVDAARELVSQHVPADLSQLLQTYDRLPTLALLARIAQRCENPELGRSVSAQLNPSAGRLCAHADAALYGSVHHNLGRCALAYGDAREAQRFFDLSLDIYRDLNASAWQMLLEADAIAALELLGEASQAGERRLVLADQARRIGLALNMQA